MSKSKIYMIAASVLIAVQLLVEAYLVIHFVFHK